MLDNRFVNGYFITGNAFMAIAINKSDPEDVKSFRPVNHSVRTESHVNFQEVPESVVLEHFTTSALAVASKWAEKVR